MSVDMKTERAVIVLVDAISVSLFSLLNVIVIELFLNVQHHQTSSSSLSFFKKMKTQMTGSNKNYEQLFYSPVSQNDE